MNLAARLVINVEGTDKSYILWNGTESYYMRLQAAYIDILNDKESEYLYFGFFTLCAATLEFSLNFILTDYCLYHYGHERYKTHAEKYIRLNFADKLTKVPEIISDRRFTFNKNNPSFRKLLELIKLRNKILHNKEFLKEFYFQGIKETNESEEINFNVEIKPNFIETLNKNMCLQFGNAMEDFKTYLMKPANNKTLLVNKMLIERAYKKM